MGEAREFALHPAELRGVLNGLFFGLGHMDLLQQAVVRRAALEAGFRGRVVVDLPDLLRALDRRVERDIGIAVLRRPDDCFGADDAGDPDPGIGLLQWHRPRVDNAVLVVRALPAERALTGP